MWTEWRPAIRAARNTLLASALAFTIGVLSVDPPDPEPTPAPVVTITDRSVRQLARALREAQDDTTAPTALVDQAEEVLGQVRDGAVTVTPTPPTTRAPEPWPSPTTTTPQATTSTTAPADTAPLEWPDTPTPTVPPPYTVTVP